MYEFSKVIFDSKDTDKRRRVIRFEVSNGTDTITEQMSFSIGTPVRNIKREIRNYIDELNYQPEPFDGDLTTEEPTEPQPTAAELAQQAWQADWQELQNIQKLIDCGVYMGTEAPIVALRNKVKSGHKREYTQ